MSRVAPLQRESIHGHRIKKESEVAVRQGVTQIILTDKNISETKLPMPMLLCIGAINTHLIKLGLRGYASINVQTGDALDTHSFATLIGVGATTIGSASSRSITVSTDLSAFIVGFTFFL